METWGVVFLGVIAAASVVQAVFLIGLARSGRRLGSRLDELQRRIERDIRPGLEHLSRVTRNLGEISDVATETTHRAAEVLTAALGRLEEAVGLVQKLLLRPLGPFADLLALLRGLQRGLSVYRQLGGVDPERRGGARRYQDDEHLFI
jgi:hypothetical protein